MLLICIGLMVLLNRNSLVCALQAEHARGFMEEKFIRPLEAIKVRGSQAAAVRWQPHICVCHQLCILVAPLLTA